MPGDGVSMSVRYKAVTFRDELIQIDLLGALVVSGLHAVEVNEFTSGQQDAFRQGEPFREVSERVCL